MCRVFHKNNPSTTTQQMTRIPMEDLARTDSLENIDHFLDFSSLPPLIDPSFTGQPNFKPINPPTYDISSPIQPHPFNSSYQPIFNHQGFGSASGSGSGSTYNNNNKEMVKMEQSLVSVSQETCLSSDVNATTTAEVSSGPVMKQEMSMMGMVNGSKSYEDLCDLRGILWDY